MKNRIGRLNKEDIISLTENLARVVSKRFEFKNLEYPTSFNKVVVYLDLPFAKVLYEFFRNLESLDDLLEIVKKSPRPVFMYMNISQLILTGIKTMIYFEKILNFEEAIDFLSKYIKLINIKAKNDCIKNFDGGIYELNKEDIENILDREFYKKDKTILDYLNKVFRHYFALSNSVGFDWWLFGSYDIHGGYDVSSKFGKDYYLVVRDFYDFHRDIFGIDKDIPEFSIYYIVKFRDFKINFFGEPSIYSLSLSDLSKYVAFSKEINDKILYKIKSNVIKVRKYVKSLNYKDLIILSAKILIDSWRKILDKDLIKSFIYEVEYNLEKFGDIYFKEGENLKIEYNTIRRTLDIFDNYFPL